MIFSLKKCTSNKDQFLFYVRFHDEVMLCYYLIRIVRKERNWAKNCQTKQELSGQKCVIRAFQRRWNPQQCKLLQDQAIQAPGLCFTSTNRAELKKERVEFLSGFASENIQRTELEANFVLRKKRKNND